MAEPASEERPPWAYLDVLESEPFFAEYKVRVRELLNPREGERHLDIGGGTGDDARAIAGLTGFAAMVERREPHAREAHDRGLPATLVADGAVLPFADAVFDSCVADRVLQHVDAPGELVREMSRVLRPGGRAVAVDPDLDTQVLNLDALDLARTVFRYRADVLRASGTIARRTAFLFRRVGLSYISVEPRTLIVTDPGRVDNVMGLRDWAQFAHEAGWISADEASAWPVLIDDVAARDEFFYAVTYFVTAGRKPAID